MKYCSKECRLKGYTQSKREAKKRYRKKHQGTLTKCAWCGKQFLSTYGRKYCSIEHKKFAREEQNRRKSIRYNLKELSEKQRYFKYLGNSNLREHKHDCFEDEERLIRAEKRRLMLWKH